MFSSQLPGKAVSNKNGCNSGCAFQCSPWLCLRPGNFVCLKNSFLNCYFQPNSCSYSKSKAGFGLHTQSIFFVFPRAGNITRYFLLPWLIFAHPCPRCTFPAGKGRSRTSLHSASQVDAVLLPGTHRWKQRIRNVNKNLVSHGTYLIPFAFTGGPW